MSCKSFFSLKPPEKNLKHFEHALFAECPTKPHTLRVAGMSAATQSRAATILRGTGERLVDITIPFHNPLSSSTHGSKNVCNFGSLSKEGMIPPMITFSNLNL